MAALNPAAPLGPFDVPGDPDNNAGNAARSTPKAVLRSPSSAAPAPNAAPLPAVPLSSGASSNVDTSDQPFQGARQFLDASHAVQNWAQGKTPSGAAPALRWNPSFGPNGTHWSDTATPGTGSFHDPEALNELLRPTTGPLSAAAITARNAYPLSAVLAPRPNIGPAINPMDGSGQASPPPPRAVLKTPAALATSAAPVPNGQGVLDGSPAGASAAGSGSGVTFDGRQLPYGAMVNGVPTFSDGTNGIPRTMTDDQIKNLGNRLNIATAPLAPLASDALGYTPSSAQMVGQNLAQLQRFQPITGSRPTAADFAASDRNAIASGDWRSAAGTAAHNLDVEAQYGTSGLARANASRQLAALQQGSDQADLADMADQSRAALTDQEGRSALQRTALQGQNALEDENLRGQYGLASARIAAQGEQARLNRPVLQPLADGSLAQIDPVTGTMRTLTQANGAPAQVAGGPAIKRKQELMDQVSRNAAQLAKGWMPPADNPQAAPPYDQFRMQAAKLAGLPVAYSQKAGKWFVNINGQVQPL